MSRPVGECRGQARQTNGGHVVRVYRRALGRTDDQVVVLPLGRGKPLLILCLSVFLQRGERSRRQSDGPRSRRRLGAVLNHRLALVGFVRCDGLDDVRGPAFEVDVTPPQAKPFTASHAFQQEQMPERVKQSVDGFRYRHRD